MWLLEILSLILLYTLKPLLLIHTRCLTVKFLTIKHQIKNIQLVLCYVYAQNTDMNVYSFFSMFSEKILFLLFQG